jgi:enediyne biosynthesis thioesterase
MTGFVYRHRVSFADTNVVGNVYFTRYLEWQGRCRELFLAEHARDVARDVASGRVLLVTVACAMDYFEECFAFDDLDIEMTLTEVTGSRIVMRFDYRRDDIVVARGSQTVACMARRDRGLAPVPIPEGLAYAANGFTPRAAAEP